MTKDLVDFTEEDFNDKIQPCLRTRCSGQVYPTRSANLGICNECGKRYDWGHYYKESRKV